MTTPTTNERRGRFSRFLEKRKEKDAVQEGRPPISNNTTNTDSAYASSDNDPARKTTPDFVPVENHDIQGVDRDRSLWYDKNNGDIYDEDTCDVITTVTTTTTTTTTTTRGGRKQEVVDIKTTQTEPQPTSLSGNNQNTSNLNRATSTTGTLPARETGGLNEMPAVTTQPTTSYTTSTIPGHTGLSAGPSTIPGSTGRETLPTRSDPSPPIPHKNPSRVSGEFSHPDASEYEQVHPLTGSAVPTSPTRHNFSYPSRSGTTTRAADEAPAKQSGGTFANLKAAAIAAHGIGETLRGTLNDAVDSRYPRGNTSKAEAANLKNKAAIDRGRNEMERFNSGREHGASHTGTSYTDPTHTGTNHTGLPNTGTSYTDTTHTGVPHAGASYTDTTHTGVLHTDTSYTDTNRTDVPHAGTSYTDTTHTGVPHTGTSYTDTNRPGVPNTNTSYADRDHTGLPHTGISHTDTNRTGAPHSGTSEPVHTPLAGNTTANPDYHPPTGTAVGNYDNFTHARGGLGDESATETKSSGFGKFFKRKPVGESQSQSQAAKYF